MAIAAKLPPNRPSLFYRSGPLLSAFCQDHGKGERRPEDWVASCCQLLPSGDAGLSRLPEGGLLRDEIRADPQSWLGPSHVDAYGDDPMVLVKLLDAGERLPVHAHPDRRFAETFLNRSRGKAEAWYTLTDGVIHLGLTRAVTVAELRDLIAAQDSAGLLELLHARRVAAGSTVYVPPGTLHTFDEGLFVVEAQEPETLSIILDPWRFDLGRFDPYLGLGFDTAMTAVNLAATDETSLVDWIRPTGGLPPSAAAFFRMSIHPHHRATTELDPAFTVVIATEGELEILPESGSPMLLRSGDTVVIPHSAGRLRLAGAGEAVAIRPPAPRAQDLG